MTPVPGEVPAARDAYTASTEKFTADFNVIYNEPEDIFVGPGYFRPEPRIKGFTMTITAPDGAQTILRSYGDPYFYEWRRTLNEDAVTQLLDAANRWHHTHQGLAGANEAARRDVHDD